MYRKVISPLLIFGSFGSTLSSFCSRTQSGRRRRLGRRVSSVFLTSSLMRV